MPEPEKAADVKKLNLRSLPGIALEGLIGNAAWALVLIIGVAVAAFLKGGVPAWLFGVALLFVLGVSGFISTAQMRQVERLRGARDEARRQAEEAVRRATEIEERNDAEKRELREQLTAATNGQQAVSTRMQSIARQAEALASTPAGDYGPDENQVELLVALVEDFSRIAPDSDPVAERLLAAWRDSYSGHTESAWGSALQMLKARAISIGTEEALGQ